MTGTGPEDFPADGEDPFADDYSYDFEGYDDAEVDEEYIFDGRAATFRAMPGGAACSFEPGQARVVRILVSNVAEIIRGDAAMSGQDATDQPDELEMLLGLSGNDELPDDPVLARLLPDAYKDDPEASAEFRRYTEESLRSSKINSAQAVLASLPASGGEVLLTEAECQHWLRALNDVRLTLGVQLGITDDNEDPTEGITADDPRTAYAILYQWITYLQDSLIEAVT